MDFLTEIKETISAELYQKLDKYASSAFSKNFHSNTIPGQESFIEELLPLLVCECERFENLGMKISPIDVINILYKCKLVRSSKTETDYQTKTYRCNLVDEFDFYVPWEKRNEHIDELIKEYFERLKSSLKENTLLIEINSFKGDSYEIQSFFDDLFSSLNYPFKAYIDKEATNKNIPTPSIGFTVFGSLCYCRWYSNAWLKSLMSLIKIAGFIHPSQINFGWDIAERQSACYPVFLGTGSSGCFAWNEDAKDPIVKIPDGCLSHSFGNRSITNMWFDIKTFGEIRKFVLENKMILELHKNPWSRNVQNDVIPILDILSSTIQSTDLGAKILLIYCCLEHLFVPQGITKNNRNYIVGGINSLNYHILDWFDELYSYRCNYAHKGYIKRDSKTIDFITLSINNVLLLLKLKVNNTSKI